MALKKSQVRIEQFMGLVKDVHPAKLPPAFFPIDQGSEHEGGAVWRPRKGRVRSNLAKLAAAPRHLACLTTSTALRSVMAVSGVTYGFTSGAAEQSGASLTANAITSTGSSAAQGSGYVCTYGNRYYYTDGERRVQRWDGLTTGNMAIAGIDPPPQTWAPTPTTAAGNTTAGSHRLRYRYKDSKTAYVSDPSNEITVTVAAGAEQLTFSIAASGTGNLVRSTDAKVDTLVVEMTTVNGGANGTFYVAAETAQTASSVVVSISDVSLADRPLLYPAGRVDNGVPAIGKYALAYLDRLWVYGPQYYDDGTLALTNASASVTGTGTAFSCGAPTAAESAFSGYVLQVGSETAQYTATVSSDTALTIRPVYAGSTGSGKAFKLFPAVDRLYFSQPGYPEQFSPFDFVQGARVGGYTTAAVGLTGGLRQGLLIYSESATELLTWTGNPATTGVKQQISTERGALHQRVVVQAEGAVYAMDRRGWHVYTGREPVSFSSKLDDLLDDLDFTYAHLWHAVYYPRMRAIRWFVTESGDTEPKTYVQFELDGGIWSTGELEVGITASALVDVASGRRVLVGDENGYTWLDDTGTCDGCAAGESHLTVGAGATTTSIPVTGATLTTDGTGLAGVMAYWVEGDESKLVSSNTSSVLTTAAFANAPAEGDTIYLGRVKAKLRTKAFKLPKLENRVSLHSVGVLFEPLSSSRDFQLRRYRDYGNADTWGLAAWAPSNRGFSHPADSGTAFSVDADHTGGYVEVGMGDSAARAVQVEIEVTEPDTRVAVLGLYLEGQGFEEAS